MQYDLAQYIMSHRRDRADKHADNDLGMLLAACIQKEHEGPACQQQLDAVLGDE